MKIKILSLFFLLGCFFFLRAEVFWLRPLNSPGQASNVPLIHQLPGLENVSPLLVEPVRINGKDFRLELYRCSAHFDDIVNYIRARGGHFVLSNDTLRCTVLLKDKTVERLLVVKSPGRGPVSVFRIQGKPGFPAPGLWPPQLPELPAGARPLQVMELPGRKSVYGAFDRGSQDAPGTFRHIDSTLRARGWIPAGKEASPLTGGTGDIYCQKNSGRLLWVTLDSNGRGAFYCRD